jgi:hypothetical protein
MNLLCRHCDVFVGYGAIGVARKPLGRSEDWLRTHCWVCDRSELEIRSDLNADVD